jgi:hypothetical protein
VQFPAVGQLTDDATAFGSGPASIEAGNLTAIAVELIAHAAPTGIPTATATPTAPVKSMVATLLIGGRWRPYDINGSPFGRIANDVESRSPPCRRAYVSSNRALMHAEELIHTRTLVERESEASVRSSVEE